MLKIRKYPSKEGRTKYEKLARKLDKGLKEELQNIKEGKPVTNLELHQILAVLNVKKHFDSGSKDIALIVAPPGSGKSGMAFLITYLLGAKKVLVLTPARIISEQLADAFNPKKLDTNFLVKCKFFEDPDPAELAHIMEKPYVPKYLSKSRKDVRKMRKSKLVIVNAQKFAGNSRSSLTIVSGMDERQEAAQKLTKRQLNLFDVVIVDEAHHYPAATWKTLIAFLHKEGKKIVFLTATPFMGPLNREVQLERYHQIQTVFEIGADRLEEKGIIRKREFKEIPLPLTSYDQLKNDIEDIFENQKKNGSRVGWEPKAMILVPPSKEATEETAEGLGLNFATFHHSGKEAEGNLQRFTTDKNVRVLVVCGSLREGFDNSDVTLVVILRKCNVRVLFEQMAGRCVRVKRNLGPGMVDNVTGVILSYEEFGQKKMWDLSQLMAESDPVEDYDYDVEISDDSDESPMDTDSDSDSSDSD